jgi:hypothetical protein
MMFIADLLFNKYTLIIVVILGVVLAIGGLSGKLLWNKYIISALVLLALGWGAYGWAFMAGESHQLAKDQPKIEKLEKQLSDYAVAAKAAELVARTKEAEYATNLKRANDDAKIRETKLASAAAATRRTAVSLRNDLTTARADVSKASRDAVNRYAETASTILGECTDEVTRLAAEAAGISSDTMKVIQTWPK